MSFGSFALRPVSLTTPPFVRVCGKTAGRRRINLLPCTAVDNGGGTLRDDAFLYVCNLQSPALPGPRIEEDKRGSLADLFLSPL
jgi:hypothetical protein